MDTRKQKSRKTQNELDRKSVNDIWNIVKSSNNRFRYAQFDEDNQEMIDLIKARTEE